jgi:hypothetical protein
VGSARERFAVALSSLVNSQRESLAGAIIIGCEAG